ncbi:ATP-dependent DNA helicase [Thraustotheca clavata]|uniref:ATP-dependent DNA helicase n=1 Tax=Thraustotheca clavata TaxID=74557 RepID=A0A1V9ZQS8_9STRA|nr:ATP-dependent DNA helicase [Thraustotheca clavata]
MLQVWDAGRFAWTAKATRLLKQLCNNGNFKPLQQAAVNLAHKGYSLFVHLPTGSGKSLCFQLPAMLQENKVTLIVSPLKSLLQDQMNSLQRLQMNEKAHFLSPGNVSNITEHVCMIYTTPEMILSNRHASSMLLELLKEDRLARIVLDEAHCILEWGSTFRPSYMELARFYKQHLPHIPVTFLTATASDELISAICRIFQLDNIGIPHFKDQASSQSMVLLQSMEDRKNLKLQVVPKPPNATILALDIVRRVGQEPTIVYVLSQKDAEAVAKSIASVGGHAQPYHAGMSDSARKNVQYQWMSGKISIVCATVAFGMGIDRADVRHVVHHALPLSLSSYMQQIGRSGRDGESATCTLYYDPKDVARASFIASGDGFVDTSTSHSLRSVVELIEETGCRRRVLYAHFGQTLDECCQNCNCGEPFEMDYPEQEKPERVQYQSSPSVNYQVERIYQTLQQMIKRDQKYRKSHGISRKTIQVLLNEQPRTREDLQYIRGLTEQQMNFLEPHLHMFRQKSRD